MSNIKKVLIVAFIAVMAFATTKNADAAFTYTSFLKQGSKGASVMSLQQTLNMTSCQVAAAGHAGSPGMETSYFGPATTAAVKCFQSANGLVADGLVGRNTGAALEAVMGGSTGGLPAGCTSTAGFSPLTGQPCNSGSTGGVVLPPGCTSTAGYSPVTGQSCASGSSTPQTGAVMASLAATNPAAGTIVEGQATADLLHIMFTGSGTVNSVTLQRSGVSDQNTLTNVYLYDGVQRLTDGYSYNTNGTIVMNNLNLSVNGSRTISVKADVYKPSSGSAGYDIMTTLVGFTSGTSVNTVNIQGNDMFIASGANLATVTLSGSNSVSAATVNAGSSSYPVWRQSVQVNTRSVWLKAANFRITGSAPVDALSNARLFIDGVDTGKVATMTMTTGSNYLSFDMSAMPVSLTTGTHTVEIRADIVKGASYNFTVQLQQASDLMIMDPQIGVNIAISSFSASNAGQITIGAGSATFTVDPSFSAMTNVTGGASNAVIGKFKIHGYGEDVKISSLPVTVALSAGATPGGIQNVSLYFNGSQVGSQVNLSSASSVPGTLASDNCATTPGTSAFTCYSNTFSLGSQLVIPAGTDSTLEVRADLRNAAGTNYTAGTISANLSAGTGEGFSSHNTVTTPSVTGTTLTIQTGTLGLSKNAGYSNQNANPNTSGVKIGSFVLQNQSTSESIRVTSLLVNVAYGASTSSSNLSGLRTSETSGNGSIPVQPATAAASASGNNTFSTDFTLAPGAVKNIDIYADSNSDAGATATVITTLTVSSLGVSSNVSATSAATTGQTITFRTGTLDTPTINTASSTVSQLIAAANGGAADGSLAQYNFTSTDASSKITELTFTVTSGTATYVKVGNVTAPVVGGTAYLTGLNIDVPNGGSGVNVSVFVSYPEVGTSGLTSPTTSTLTLTTIKSTSGNTTTTDTVSVAADPMTLVGSKPAYTLSGSTDTLLNGSVKIAEVTVSADAKGDIKIGKLPITVTSTGVAAIASGSDNIIVKDTSGATIATKNATFAVAAGGSGTGIICFDTTTAACASGNAVANAYLIPAGTSKTFRIYVTASSVAGAVNTTSLSTKLGASSSATYYDVAGGASAAQAATLLYGYPTDSVTIHN